MKKKNVSENENVLALEDDGDFLFTEAFKTLRTNLLFSLAARNNNRVAITSSLPGEGKSLIALNLAYSLSQSGKKVCLVDADMRSPKIHRYLKIRNDTGLSSVLSGQEVYEKCIYRTKYDNLFVIKAGQIPPNPAELLNSKFFDPLFEKLDATFDYVVIDTPPINVVSDALVVAGHNTGLLFVVRENISLHEELKKSLRSIEMSDIDLVGIAVNDADVEIRSGGYRYGRYGKYGRYGHYGKYGYGYGYGYGATAQKNAAEDKNKAKFADDDEF